MMHFGKVGFFPFVVCHLLSSPISPFTSTFPPPSTLPFVILSQVISSPLFLHFSFHFFFCFYILNSLRPCSIEVLGCPFSSFSFKNQFFRSYVLLEVGFVGRSRAPHSLKLVSMSVV